MLESHLRDIMAQFKIDDISELMQTTGISRNSINKLYKETDMESLKLETLIKICDTFQIRLSSLIEYIPDSLFEEDTSIPIDEITNQIHEMLIRGVQQHSFKQSIGRVSRLKKEDADKINRMAEDIRSKKTNKSE
jgi:putative transcriptional regulator